MRLILTSLALLLSVLPTPTFASSGKLPDVMAGQASVIVDGKDTYYGSFNGNEAVVNYSSDDINVLTPPTFKLGFARSISSCGLSVTTACFILETFPSIANGIQLMTSRTLFSDPEQSNKAMIEVAATVYPKSLALGDIYSRDGLADSFKYWGKNLAQSQTNGLPKADSAWKLGNYTLNPQAQSTWLKGDGATETEVYKQYKEKIDVLASEGVVINDATHSLQNMNAINLYNWYLQNAGVPSGTDINKGAGIYTSTTPSEASAYPEGKVWVVDGDLNLTNHDHLYYGKGTIIVKGNMTIGDGVSIEHGDRNSRLGIIVTGNITFAGNNKIQAAIFSRDTFTVQRNNTIFSGAFVAKNFNISSASNSAFYYDYSLGQDWPSGFRYLNMPQAEE